VVLFLAGWVLLFVVDPGGARLLHRWSLSLLVESLALTPAILLVTALIFFVMGAHWRQIGRW
jgi:hypothetical protein